MALLTILEFPDPRLRTRAKPVATVDSRIQRLVDDMFETMYAAPGIGLAASQVDVHERVIVMDLSEDHTDPRVFINPEITIVDNTLGNYDEGSTYYEGVGHAGALTAVRISPDEARIISTGTEGGIFLWKVPADFAPY